MMLMALHPETIYPNYAAHSILRVSNETQDTELSSRFSGTKHGMWKDSPSAPSDELIVMNCNLSLCVELGKMCIAIGK